METITSPSAVRPVYRTYTESRAHLRDVMDAAAAGMAPMLGRDRQEFVVLDPERLRSTLAALINPDTQVFAEPVDESGTIEWGGYVPAIPSVSGTGDTLDELMDDLVLAARAYAADWHRLLRDAPNHEGNWGFVQLVDLSADAQIRTWLAGTK